MKTSSRINDLSPSPTVALNARATELRASGIDILNFAVGEPDFSTPKPIVDIAIQALKDGKTKYGPAGGGLPFRKAICEKLKRENGLNYSPNEIVCGIGAKEILFHIFLSLINEGDEVILTAPCWVSYKQQIAAAGGVPVIIPMPDDPDAPLVDVRTIEKYSTDKTVAFVLCSPNNPAGNALATSELETLGNYLSEKDWWLISDEIYEYLSFDQEHKSISNLVPKLHDKTIIVNGMSKGYAMTGWRVGYCAGPESVTKLVKRLQSHSSTCLPPFIEEAATWAISKGSDLMSEEAKIMAKRRDLAMECLKDVPNVSYVKPQGAFYLFVDIRKVLKQSAQYDEFDSIGFGQHLLNEHHIAVVPGEAFETPGFLRFSYAVSDQAIKDGIGRFKKAIESIA